MTQTLISIIILLGLLNIVTFPVGIFILKRYKIRNPQDSYRCPSYSGFLLFSYQHLKAKLKLEMYFALHFCIFEAFQLKR